MNLQKMREAAGLSQTDVAKTLRVDVSTVGHWEAGDAMPRAAKLPKLADLFGCTIDELFGRDSPPAAG